MKQDEKIQLRKKCCEESEEIIRGRRMTDLESKIFHEWTDILNYINEEELNEILEKYMINR